MAWDVRPELGQEAVPLPVQGPVTAAFICDAPGDKGCLTKLLLAAWQGSSHRCVGPGLRCLAPRLAPPQLAV